MANSNVTSRFLLSVGGGWIRLWERQRGLVAEIPPCVVIEKDTGEIKFYGEEAADLEGKTPAHLEFVRVWSGDKIMDRVLLRSLLQYILNAHTQTWSERWQRAVQTTLVVPETVSALHLRWLRRTAREAGWLLIPVAFMGKSFLARQQRPRLQAQGILDLGFTGARLIVLVGDDVVLAESDHNLSLQAYVRELVEFLRHKHQLEVNEAVFYDQLWHQSRYMFHLGTKAPQSYVPTPKDVEGVNTQFQSSLGQFLQRQLAQLSEAHQAELQQNGIWLIGGAAELLSEEREEWPVPLKRSSDARYAVLRALSKQTKK